MKDRRKAMIRKRAQTVATAAVNVDWTREAYTAWSDLCYIADSDGDEQAAAYASTLIDSLEREHLTPDS